MSAPAKVLFVDRDGTLIEEPADQQIDRYEKFRLLPGAIAALRRLVDAGYALVMVTNQDGLGTAGFPEQDFAGPQRLLLEILAGEGIAFREVLIDRSFAHEHAPTRKPGLGLVQHWLGAGVLDRARSVPIACAAAPTPGRITCVALRMRAESSDTSGTTPMRRHASTSEP